MLKNVKEKFDNTYRLGRKDSLEACCSWSLSGWEG